MNGELYTHLIHGTPEHDDYIERLCNEQADQIDSIHGALSRFMDEMIGRMVSKHEQGFRGWNDPSFLPIYRRKMLDCAARVYAGDSSQCVDLGNWAMILDYCERKKAEAVKP